MIYFFHVKKRTDRNRNLLKNSVESNLVSKLNKESVQFFKRTKTTIKYKFMQGLVTLFNPTPNIQIFEINASK